MTCEFCSNRIGLAPCQVSLLFRAGIRIPPSSLSKKPSRVPLRSISIVFRFQIAKFKIVVAVDRVCVGIHVQCFLDVVRF